MVELHPVVQTQRAIASQHRVRARGRLFGPYYAQLAVGTNIAFAIVTSVLTSVAMQGRGYVRIVSIVRAASDINAWRAVHWPLCDRSILNVQMVEHSV